MTKNNLLVTINTRIDAIRASEKITKVELGSISRELLLYVPDSKDIDAVNRLLDVLTPMNYRTAQMFFANFLPWVWDEKNNRFAAMSKGDKAINGKLDSVKAFLEEPANNIWLWAERNIKLEPVKTPFGERLTALVAKSLKGEKGLDPIGKADIVAAVMAGGVSAGDLINIMEEAKAAFEQAQRDEEAARLAALDEADKAKEAEAVKE